MKFTDIFMQGYESILHFVAEFTVHTLELVGILIIISGSVKAIAHLFRCSIDDTTFAVQNLGGAFAGVLCPVIKRLNGGNDD